MGPGFHRAGNAAHGLAGRGPGRSAGSAGSGRHIGVTPGCDSGGLFVIDDTVRRLEIVVNQELALAHIPMVLFVQ